VGPWGINLNKSGTNCYYSFATKFFPFPSCSSSSSVEHVHHHPNHQLVSCQQDIVPKIVFQEPCMLQQKEREKKRETMTSWGFLFKLELQMGADYLGAMENCRFFQSRFWMVSGDTHSFCNRIGFMLFKDGPLCPKFCIHLGSWLYVWNSLPLRGHMFRILLNIPVTLCMEIVYSTFDGLLYITLWRLGSIW